MGAGFFKAEIAEIRRGPQRKHILTECQSSGIITASDQVCSLALFSTHTFIARR
jgi:hypothetical protein